MEKILGELEDWIWTEKYLEYLRQREKGVRQKSQIALVEFFEIFRSRDTTQRRNFIDFVCTLSFKTKEYSMFLPENMYQHIFLPELSDWIADEPTNPIPFKWTNDFENNRKAIELDPNDQIGLERFAQLMIGKISMNQHELSSTSSYDGIASEDIIVIQFFEKFLNKIVDLERQTTIRDTLAELKKSALQYQANSR